jgi:hypothetical protein
MITPIWSVVGMGPSTAKAAETALRAKAAERRARVFITILPNLRNSASQT